MVQRHWFAVVVCLVAVLAGGSAGPASAQEFSSATQARPAGNDESNPEFRAKKAELMRQLQNLPPEERRQKIEELKAEAAQRRQQALDTKKQQFQAKWDQASPEKRAKFCANVTRRCADIEADGKGRMFACAVAKDKCAGNAEQ